MFRHHVKVVPQTGTSDLFFLIFSFIYSKISQPKTVLCHLLATNSH